MWFLLLRDIWDLVWLFLIWFRRGISGLLRLLKNLIQIRSLSFQLMRLGGLNSRSQKRLLIWLGMWEFLFIWLMRLIHTIKPISFFFKNLVVNRQVKKSDKSFDFRLKRLKSWKKWSFEMFHWIEKLEMKEGIRLQIF